MANQLGTGLVTPRCYSQHQRHERHARVRHAKQFPKFLAVEATRLSSTANAIFTYLLKNTAQAVRSAAATGDLS